ncbi:MAG: bacterial Ig-like domain-containing protein [Lachnospiraceae bacterium]|nr:bacterial Ig-like domain-containing protein [Lachnospiraceae bacterium]
MSEKKSIDKEYLIASLKSFNEDILSKIYIDNEKLDRLILKDIEQIKINTESGRLVDALILKEVFQSVSDGKSMIASAITDKGVDTDAMATFFTMAQNIRKLVVGSDIYPVSIEVETPPEKLEYHPGDILDLTGMVVNAVFNDGSKQDITLQCETVPADGTVLDKKTNNIVITWACPTLENSYQVTQSISMQVPYQISIKKNPTKLSYIAGESLDLTGMMVVLDYLDGGEDDITNQVTVTPAEGTEIYEDTKSLKIDWTNAQTEEVFTTSINISVTRVLQSITVSTPTKTNYVVGDTLDLSGINVIAHYTSGATEDVTQESTFSPENGTEFSDSGTITITATYTENGITKTTTTSVEVEEAFGIVTWTNGTDEQIAAMLNAHYAGEINIHDYWKVGDERTVHLSAMDTDDLVGETQKEQDVVMVLMNEGGKELSESINGHTECAFIVGQKNCLRTSGYMNPDKANDGGWNECARRAWCNQTYRNSLPDGFRELFKQHKNITSSGGTSPEKIMSIDYFAFVSEKELMGSIEYSNADIEDDNKQFEWYTTSGNRLKSYGYGGSHWTRTASTFKVTGADDINVAFVFYAKTVFFAHANNAYGIAPFGCI